MMHDDRVGALLGHEHEVLAQGNADGFGLEELDDFGAVFQAGAGAVAEAVGSVVSVGVLSDTAVSRTSKLEGKEAGTPRWSSRPKIPWKTVAANVREPWLGRQ